MIPRTTTLPSALIEIHAVSLGRTVTSNGVSAGAPAAEDAAAGGSATGVPEAGAGEAGAGDTACTGLLEGGEDCAAADSAFAGRTLFAIGAAGVCDGIDVSACGEDTPCFWRSF